MGLMFRRRRPVARMAVGAATAGVAYRAGQRRAEQAEPDQPPPLYIAPSPASTGNEVDELSRLAQMHESGVLTDDEFAAAKTQLLGR